ncbi:hypothetical protein F4779DRAFT_572772 [Xylariaceae sp. FL0662B]|nr:hypothetical protein F4779DRAFT_572772 [Xylariaceae sp. FL0662B]
MFLGGSFAGNNNGLCVFMFLPILVTRASYSLRNQPRDTYFLDASEADNTTTCIRYIRYIRYMLVRIRGSIVPIPASYSQLDYTIAAYLFLIPSDPKQSSPHTRTHTIR